MLKKNTSLKIIKYYNFINYNLIYGNKAINRYKKENYEISQDKIKSLELLKKNLNGFFQVHQVFLSIYKSHRTDFCLIVIFLKNNQLHFQLYNIYRNFLH